jgi:hypothetical protein
MKKTTIFLGIISLILIVYTNSLFAQDASKTTSDSYSGSYGGASGGYSSSEIVTVTAQQMQEARNRGTRDGAEDGRKNDNRSRARNPYNSSDPRYDEYMASYRSAFADNSKSGSIEWNDTGWW